VTRASWPFTGAFRGRQGRPAQCRRRVGGPRPGPERPRARDGI